MLGQLAFRVPATSATYTTQSLSRGQARASTNVSTSSAFYTPSRSYPIIEHSSPLSQPKTLCQLRTTPAHTSLVSPLPPGRTAFCDQTTTAAANHHGLWPLCHLRNLTTPTPPFLEIVTIRRQPVQQPPTPPAPGSPRASLLRP